MEEKENTNISHEREDSGIFPSLTELINTLPDGRTNDEVGSLHEPKEESDSIESSPELHDISYDDSSLFVGDIARTLTEEQLKEIFSPFGEVVNAEIKRDKITRTSLGYAFVQFKTRQEAVAAKKNLHKTMLANRPIRIGWAQKNTNLFVGDLDPSVTSDMLRDAFRVFGDIVEDETFAKNQNYGFVKFKRRMDAETAKREMDGRVLGGRRIRTGWGDSNTQRHCVHIQFDPDSPTGDSHPSPSSPTLSSPTLSSPPPTAGVLSETDLYTSFSPYGTVLNVHLPRSASRLRGFGFVRYNDTDEGEESAEAAITALHNTHIAGVLVSCNFGKKQHTKRGNSTPSATSVLPPLPSLQMQDPALYDNVTPLSDHSPTSPKEIKNQQLSRENAFTTTTSNGNDDNIPKNSIDHANPSKLADGTKHNSGYQRTASKGRTRPSARNKQHSYHPSSSPSQRQPYPNSYPNNHHVLQPLHQHSSQNSVHHQAHYSHHQPQYKPQHTHQHVSQHSPQHSPQLSSHHRPRHSNRSYVHQQIQPQPNMIDSHQNLSIPPQQSLPPMYHGAWITQGWIPYMVPQYYPAIHPLDDMQDNTDIILNANGYHMSQDASNLPPMYMYEYSNPINPAVPPMNMNVMNSANHPLAHINSLNQMNPVNNITQPFHQSYDAYAYSSHGT